jgi:acyl-CoA thioester hydrolase
MALSDRADRIARVFEPGHATGRKPPFRFAAYTRVAFSDTDAQGVVYYGRYLPYFDLARTEYHRHLGRSDDDARSEFVMRASDVEYHAPARFDDLLEVFVRVPRVGRTSVTYEYAAYRLDHDGEERLMVTAIQTVVLIDRRGRRTLLVPDAFRDGVAGFEGTGA